MARRTYAHDEVARAIVRDVLIAVTVAIAVLLGGGAFLCWIGG